MNELQIDPAQLQSEAAQLAGEFPQAPTPDAAAEPAAPAVNADAAKGYEILAMALVGQGAAVFVPAWEVTEPEVRDLSNAIVEALLLWFPDGVLPAKYIAVLAVVGVGTRIAMARRDPSTGGFKPTKYAKPAATKSADPDKPA